VVIIEVISIVIEDAIKGIEGNQLEIILPRFSRTFEKLIEHIRGCDDRRAAIKFKSIDIVLIAPSARFIAFFKYLDLVSLLGEPDCSPQTAKATTNDNNMFLQFSLPEQLLNKCGHLCLPKS